MRASPPLTRIGLSFLSLLAFAFAVSQVPGVAAVGAGGGVDLLRQPRERAEAGSAGCLTCHAGIEPMHASPAVQLSCVDCHGGDSGVRRPESAAPESPEVEAARVKAHVAPRFPERWSSRDGRPSAANPERSYTLTLEESPEWIRFVNPGDLRVARTTCGPCHLDEVNRVV
ncbi:MAG TPA: cytochrome c3 family protein, partial [Thermoanaerobaculia bacterium]|nr:cytochrome c3 family protein [Thermoanaerobaculia bacterium]